MKLVFAFDDEKEEQSLMSFIREDYFFHERAQPKRNEKNLELRRNSSELCRATQGEDLETKEE
eukprot:CAMPEP_0202973224 /NCGR_PEP_ID=MMETSP1396-20130829/47820_1 /ASSEMBLY_ACC=CAM_ASM_000872 /TAXON_ID= /ORGANISM="Pseudokeronopsis sp., Strain Brazil" /LENGTH=62 /DNA_ID=CAMNT_0049704893 /DNA_START=561 /DNA_END=746 /DNA_ORIENTATION=+